MKGDEKPDAAKVQSRDQGSSASKVAKLLGVSERLVYDAIKLRKLSEAEFDKVWRGVQGENESKLLTIGTALKKLEQNQDSDPQPEPIEDTVPEWQQTLSTFHDAVSNVQRPKKLAEQDKEAWNQQLDQLIEELEKMKFKSAKKKAA